MPLFLSDKEFQDMAENAVLVAEKADAYIRGLLQQLEAHRARADAAAIMAEQRGAVVEQKFLTMSSQFKQMEDEKNQLEQTLERRASELAEVQAQLHAFELKSMKHDSDKERILCQLNEARNAKRELMEVIEQKNAELIEKNSHIKGYLDKIVFLTDERSILEGKLREADSGFSRSQATQARLLQEKELLEQHNTWLNQELTDQMNTLLRDRKTSSDVEMELRSKLSIAEQTCKETKEALQRSKEQVKELEVSLIQTREELQVAREDAAAKEDHLTLEVETASKLAELYKQSSEEWAKKAVDLEGVIKALEVHLNQVVSDHKSELEKEVQSRKDSEQRTQEFEDKVEKLETELIAMKSRQEDDSLLLLEDIPNRASQDLPSRNQQLLSELHEDGVSLPLISTNVSGTALAAALLRDGWNLTKVYIKYQEAVDAWRHERQERRYSQTILQRVLQEIEQRADLILEERAEHSRMAEAYAIMEEKLHASIEEQNSLENQIRILQVECRKQDRELHGARKDCSNLQTEVAVLLKECADIKLRFGGNQIYIENAPEKKEPLSPGKTSILLNDRLLTFKNILELVEQNSELHAAVRALSHENEEYEAKLKEAFDLELKKRTDDATQKVATIVKKSEEQMQLIQSLQGTVGMYKRFYEEELKSQQKSNGVLKVEDVTRAKGLQNLVVTSQEDIEKVRKDNTERLTMMEKELIKARQDAKIIRAERDRLIVEADYTKEQLQRFVKDSENQRKEMDAVLARNVEFSQIITDYQRRLRESSEIVQSAEEKSRRFSVEVSVLEREKELLTNAEKKVCQELASLSDRAHRLQATLDSIDTVKEAQEQVRSAEKKKLEDEVNRMQREWMDMKHELDSERAHARLLSNERDQTAKETIDRIQLMSKDLADALKKLSTAETQGHLAEARSRELESSLKKAEEKVQLLLSQQSPRKDSKDTTALESTNQAVSILEQLEDAREQIDRLTEELGGSKNHVEQYKRLAQHNEEALVEIQKAYNGFKKESEKVKDHFMSELTSVKEKSMDLERQLKVKEMELKTVIEEKEDALRSSEKEAYSLREADSGNRLLLGQFEERIQALKSEVEKEHFQWRSAQNNYERQVVLQADTIRELTSLSERNTLVEKEVLELRTKADLAMTDLTSSRVSWDMEKAALQSDVENLARKIKELQDQNRILLDQVQGATEFVTEQGRTAGDHLDTAANTGNDIQDVIRYLRRSKETCDVEIALLKQERLRLQKQLESALRAAEEAQASLRRQHEATRLTLCTEQEFRLLQAQVREMTLLRESNEQLRLENKRNFEECQNLAGKLQKLQEEIESLQKMVRDKEVELDATIKVVDLQKAEASRWENRASQLLEKYRTVDVEEYNRLQSELYSTQETSALYQSELEATRGTLQKLQEAIHSAEQEISVKGEKISELETKAKDLEASMQVTVKAETDKLRKQVLFFKRKTETLMKEKDDTRDSLSKQLDELRANANKKGGDPHRSENQIRQEIASQHEQAQKENENLLREKDSRIQTLERTLEREREELRKDKEMLRTEKGRRQKDRQAYMDAVAKLDSDKQKLLEELNVLKREKESFSENAQGKKTGRKIVRPKIESPVESHIQLEANDMAAEALIEAAETEAEVRDDAKPSAEMLETVTTTSAIVVASTSTVADTVPAMRKRFSVSMHGDELTSGAVLSNDSVPLFKRQRGLECETASMASTTIVESIVTVEPSKSLDMDLENAAAVDLAPLDAIDTNPPDSFEESRAAPMMEQSQGIRPQAAQKEQILLKRPRIVRSDFMPPTSLEKEETAITLEKDRAFVADHVPENVATEEKGVQYGTPFEESTETEAALQLQSPQRPEDVDNLPESMSLEASGFATPHSLPQDSLLTAEMDDSEDLLIVVNNTSNSLPAVASTGALTPLEPGFVTLTEAEHEASIQEIPLSNTSRPSDSVLDVEDGEIEPDDQNESVVDSLLQQIAVEVSEDRNGSDLLLDRIRKHEEHTEETPHDDKESDKTKDLGSFEGSNVIQKPDEGHVDKYRSHTVARQAGRGVSSLLIEKARERSISRRAGSLPSPGRRISRGARRSAGLQHGRIINSTALEEEKSKEEGPESTETELAQAPEAQNNENEEE